MADLLSKPGGRYGAYFHIPFCDTKCVYCDFYSLTNHDQAVRFYAALKNEISLRLKSDPVESPLSSIFFGGGTPSLAKPVDLGDCIRILGDQVQISSEAEITLEANPGTLTPEKLDSLLNQGFNRISMGVQSFSESDLKFLSRIHSADTAKKAVNDAASAGFTNISIDLIFGLPGQTAEAWTENLQQAILLPISHISCYNLIVEEKTPLFNWVNSGKVQVPDDDHNSELYDITIRFLRENGFNQYEVSNFCKPGRASVHNSTYWSWDPWLAFGPSAHGFNGQSRYKNFRNLGKYIDNIEKGNLPEEDRESLDQKTIINEKLMLGVRTTEGVTITSIWTHLKPDEANNLRKKLDRFEKKGYLNWSDSFLKATPEGLRFGDFLAEELFIDPVV
ncbi:MAG: radical SAM family heme chaperone HemW [Bacteroidetes bacterium]|nr:radical SAM family heme chaperone HemW [Bacteroidota bacterium]